MKKLVFLWLFVFGSGLVLSCSSPPECEVDQECQPGYLCEKERGKCYCPGTVCAGRCTNLTKDNSHCGACNNTCRGGQVCTFGKCECAGEKAFCDNKCLDVNSNAKHCGSCDNECKGTAVCLNGKCRDKCPEKTPNVCDGGCVNHKTDDSHCGKCNVVCNNGQQCRDGQCRCTGGLTKCGDKCVDVDLDPSNCGTCGKACGSGEKCASGRCLSDCPKSTPTVCFGSCVDLKSNRAHCGQCGTICSKGKVCASGACECPAGQIECDGECVDKRTDQRHCGACNNACPSGQVCSDGQCLQDCPKSTEEKCFGGCFNLKNNPKNCGACGKNCAEGQVCNGGKCECPSPYKLCGGKCVINKIHPLHCGECDNACAAGKVCNNGKCATSCPAGQGVCYGGCIDTKTSLEHCGGCGVKCGINRVCKSGACGCPGEQTDCGNTCVDLQSDVFNCGACANRCKAGEKCLKGKCEIVCDTKPFDTNCSGACIDIVSDKRHCGSCGNVCSGRKVCGKDKNNKIACVCPSGYADCNGVCIDLKTDVKNCGACGTACDPGKVCTGGKCELNCAKGEEKCSGVCIDTKVDRRHCGGCGKACPGGATCDAGSCKCANNRTDCGGICLNTDIDPNHCGKCGNKCPAGQRCEGGKCLLCPSTAKTCGTNCCPGALACCGGNTCANTQSDYRHCGACGRSCKNRERCCGGSCSDILVDKNNCGGCGIQCKTGQTCCQGACIDVNTDKTHCGACGNICDNDSDCCGGVCKNLKKDSNHCSACGKSCQAGEGCCNGACLKLQSDSKNCGACGNVCPTGFVCCGGGCVNLKTDAKYCGSCQTPCPQGQSCNNGKCEKSWAASAGGFAPFTGEQMLHMGTDSSGNIYVVGAYAGVLNLGSKVQSLAGYTSLFIAKYNSQFVLQWVQSISGDNSLVYVLFGGMAAVDKNGNTYVTGAFSQRLVIGNTTLSSTLNGNDIFVAKVDKDGKLQWVARSKGTSSEYSRSIAVDGNGNVVVTGAFFTSFAVGNITVSSGGSQDAFVAKLDSSGKWLWASSVKGTRDNDGYAVAIDKSGNILMGGVIGGKATLGTLTLNPTSTTTNGFVAKLDSSGKPLWANVVGSRSSAVPRGVGVDSSGNVYLTGYFISNATFGTGSAAISLSSRGSVDTFISKLDGNGKWLWAKPFGSTSSDYPNGLKVDNSGNVYLTGYFRGRPVLDGINVTLTSRGSYDIFVVKMDTNGKWVQGASMGGGSSDYGVGINLDASGNVLLSGYVYTGAVFGKTQLTTDGSRDGFIAKLDSKFVPTTVKAISSSVSSNDRVWSIATDSNGNVVVVGTFFGTLTLGTITLKENANQPTFQDILVAKLDRTGKWLWAKRYGSNSYEEAKAVAIDKNNNIYVTGNFSRGFDFGPNKLTSKGNNDIFLLKLDSNGKEVWAQSGGSTSNDESLGVAVDNNGNAFVVGHFSLQTEFLKTTLYANNRSTDIFVAKAGPSGKWLWAKTFGSAGSDYGRGIAVDSKGNALVTGFYKNTMLLGNTVLLSKGSYDAFVAKIDATGKWQWAKSTGDTSSDYGISVSSDSSDNVLLTGYYYRKAVFGTTTLNAQSGTRDVFAAKLDANGKWLWAFSAGGSSSDHGYAITSDANNNVYVTGNYSRNGVFGTNRFTSLNAPCFVFKLNKDGKFQWATSATSNSGGQACYSIQVSNTGKIYVGGFFSGSGVFDAQPLNSFGSDDVLIWQVSPLK